MADFDEEKNQYAVGASNGYPEERKLSISGTDTKAVGLTEAADLYGDVETAERKRSHKIPVLSEIANSSQSLDMSPVASNQDTSSLSRSAVPSVLVFSSVSALHSHTLVPFRCCLATRSLVSPSMA